MVCVWEDGKKWCQVISTNDIESMTKFYKKNYDRFTIEERDYGNPR